MNSCSTSERRKELILQLDVHVHVVLREDKAEFEALKNYISEPLLNAILSSLRYVSFQSVNLEVQLEDVLVDIILTDSQHFRRD